MGNLKTCAIKSNISFGVIFEKKLWCDRGDLNSHTRRALPPQGSVSTVPPRSHLEVKAPKKRCFTSCLELINLSMGLRKVL